MLGRLFTEKENEPGKDGVVILGYAVWQQRFGGDRGILGRTLDLNGRSRTVIAVIPRGFEYLETSPARHSVVRRFLVTCLGDADEILRRLYAQLGIGLGGPSHRRGDRGRRRRMDLDVGPDLATWSFRPARGLRRSRANCSSTERTARRNRPVPVWPRAPPAARTCALKRSAVVGAALRSFAETAGLVLGRLAWKCCAT